ncbi:hypothetical protein [Kribbella deserti]|uniref:DUF998 domain-containing protein n=1 Tax=Kribbella deserti TaxID=1926257 RepID=A0ABV6QVC1_9ACTN
MSTDPATGTAVRKPTPTQRRAVGTLLLVLLVCGLGGSQLAPHVVGALGRIAGHDELALRLIGWCWGGGPLLAWSLLVWLKERMSRPVKVAIGYAGIVWAGSAAMLLPGRHETDQERFGAALADSRPLGFGWACGFLVLFLYLLLLAIASLLFRKFRPEPTTKAHLTVAGRVATTTWLILLAASLAAALFAPRP